MEWLIPSLLATEKKSYFVVFHEHLASALQGEDQGSAGFSMKYLI